MAKKTTPKVSNPFTPDELSKLSGVFHRVWDYVGSDALQATQECEGRDYMTKAEVIEVSLDAGRPEEMAKGDEKELVKRFMALPFEQQEKLVKPMFQFARYGM
jgi:hypothetical protein